MDQYIKVMADYFSTGLWGEDGINVDVENFALSAGTVTALKEWCDLYETNDDYLDIDDRKQPLFDLQAFADQGRLVAQAIKKDLPDFKILYSDEYALYQHIHNQDIEYISEIL